MRVKSKTLYTWAFGFLLLLDINFFYLISLPGFLSQYNSMYSKALIAIISIILGSFCLSKHRNFFKEYKFVKNYCLFTLLLSLILIAHGIISYSQGILSLVKNCDFLLIGFLSIPILYTLRENKSFNSLMKLLNTFAGIWYFLIIVQRYLYTVSGLMFLKYFSNDTLWYRNGVRFSLLAVGSLMIYYNFYMVFDEFQLRRHKLKYIIMLFAGVYATIFVQQTRSVDFAMVLAFAVMYLMKSKNAKRTLRNYGIVIIVFALLWFSGVIPNFIQSFSIVESLYARSTTVRQEAIIYFSQYWIRSPLFGIGLTNNEAITRGPLGNYYLSDIGFIGLLVRIGISAFILYGAIIIRWIKIILNLRKNSKEGRGISVFLIGLFIYFIAPIYSFTVFSTAFSISVPIMIAIFEFCNKYYTLDSMD